MDNLLTQVDTNIKEIKDISCIEVSSLKEIAYVAGFLSSRNARQSSPLVLIDLLKQKIFGNVQEI